MNRASGVLLHPTSLPGRFGIGELGAEAFQSADWLAKAGQRIWQVLPLGPTGYGESPYQLFSAFAGNPWLLSLDKLVERGWLAKDELRQAPAFADRAVDFERVMPWKTRMLRRAFAGFRADAEFADFSRDQKWWLDDFAQFMGLKEANGGVEWSKWDPQIPAREEDVEFHRFLQFEFF